MTMAPTEAGTGDECHIADGCSPPIPGHFPDAKIVALSHLVSCSTFKVDRQVVGACF